jgi:putative FmdB family regulatory protein
MEDRASAAPPPAALEVTMPTYEYHCPACKKSYELRQGFDAETTHVCEECGKGTAKRVLHAPKVLFKGSGWYVTDSKGKSSAVTDGDSSGSDSKSSDSDASSEKPAASSTPDTKSEPTAAG